MKIHNTSPHGKHFWNVQKNIRLTILPGISEITAEEAELFGHKISHDTDLVPVVGKEEVRVIAIQYGTTGSTTASEAFKALAPVEDTVVVEKENEEIFLGEVTQDKDLGPCLEAKDKEEEEACLEAGDADKKGKRRNRPNA